MSEFNIKEIEEDAVSYYLAIFQTSFNEGDALDQFPVRVVQIPAEEYREAKEINDVLNLAFKYGQNDFQPLEMYSASVGDVIQLFVVNGNQEMKKYFAISAMGFTELVDHEAVQIFLDLPQTLRSFGKVK